MANQQPIHNGHRQRMRERLKNAGNLDSFAPHEILEILLFYIFPRGNTNPLAHRLMDKFGTIKGVLGASSEELGQIDSMGESGIFALKFFDMLIEYVAHEEIRGVSVKDFENVKNYVCDSFKNNQQEAAKAFCVNSANQIKSVNPLSVGSEDSVSIDYKEIVKIALNNDCSYIILAHNHPQKTSKPSFEDIASTRRLISCLRTLDITLFDHFVIGNDGIVSMRESGFIHIDE